MFHAFDNAGPSRPTDRPAWLALLARAPLPLLENVLGARIGEAPQWLRPPETGLYMVQGRVGGTGERFNLGEVTVTRCALRPRASRDDEATGPVGVAYVLGRSHRHAHLAALADALLQDPSQLPVLEQSLLAPVRQHLARTQDQHNRRTQSTRVNFFTVARESGSADSEENES